MSSERTARSQGLALSTEPLGRNPKPWTRVSVQTLHPGPQQSTRTPPWPVAKQATRNPAPTVCAETKGRHASSSCMCDSHHIKLSWQSRSSGLRPPQLSTLVICGFDSSIQYIDPMRVAFCPQANPVKAAACRCPVCVCNCHAAWDRSQSPVCFEKAGSAAVCFCSPQPAST